MSEHESKKQILKSTGILGSAQLIIIFVGIIRVKVLALLLGAQGVGIAGIYQSTIDLIKSATGFGIGYSAVRDIAASAATQDEQKIASTVLVLRRWVWATGILGMLVAIIFSRPLSRISFGSDKYATGIIILSVGLLLSAISSGQAALLQGLRKIGAMAKANVLGAAGGLVGATAIYYFWGLQGIVPALLLTFVVSVVVNWYYSKKIKTVPVRLSYAEVFQKGKAMAVLGLFLTLTGLASTGTMYIVRSYIFHKEGLTSVGYFVAAWSISSMYISAIFGAMGADFFPRLSGVQNDKAAVVKMVNEQTEVAVLITAPIIIGMVTFIRLVVRIFYSKEFGPTASILDWQLTGDFFRVLAWPIGFIMLVKGKGKIFIVAELTWNIIFCAGVFFGWKLFGIQSTGIAFIAAYIAYLGLTLGIAYKLVHFSYSKKVRRAILIFLPLLILSFLSVKLLSGPLQIVIGGLLVILSSVYSYLQLRQIIDIKNSRLLKIFRR